MFLPLFQQFLMSRSESEDTEKQLYKEPYSQDPHLLSTSRNHLQRPALDGNDIQAFPEDMEDMDSTRSYRILPIFSGIMIPFSIMLLIPSLTGHWYVRTGTSNEVLEVRTNSPLLKLAMGFSLGCGVIASACLVARFAERNIKLSTYLCIFFLSLHDLINIPVVTVFGVVHRFDDGFTYGQPFWLTVCSTIASTATNVTLIYDYKQTVNFAHSGSGLTHKQRSLVIIVIILLAYMSLGSGVLAFMLKITFVDALYLSVVSIETIGFGDIHPTTSGSRVFMCFYIAGGIMNLALALALSREALLEAAAIGFQKRMNAFRALERKRHILARWRAAVRWRLRSKGLPVWIDDHVEEHEERIGLGRRHHWYSSLRRFWRRLWDELWREWEDPAWKYVYGPNQTRLNIEALSHSELETAALETGAPLSELVPKGLKLRNREQEDVNSPSSHFPSGDTNINPPSLTHVRIAGMVSLLTRFAVSVTHEAFKGEPVTDSQDSDEDIQEGRRPTGNGVPLTRSLTMTMTIQEDQVDLAESLEIEERYAFYARLGVALTLFVVFWMAGAAIFMKTENWGFGLAVYFCFISFSSVGYGDFSPETPAGRSIFVVWALLGVGTMTILISILAEAYSSRYKSFIRSEVLKAKNFEVVNQPSPGFSTLPNTSNAQRCVSFCPSPVATAVKTSDPSSSAPQVGESITLAMPSTTSGFCVSDGPSSCPLAEGTVQEQLDKLSFQITQHAITLRSIMGIEVLDKTDLPSEKVGVDSKGLDALNQDALRSQIEKSLKEVTKAVNDALAASKN